MNKGFEDLAVWQKSIDFSVDIYQITKGFPNEEKFGLVSQLRRAAVSISSNIAEGSTRGSKEFAHFLSITLSSIAEVKTQLIIAQRVGYLNKEETKKLITNLDELGRMSNGLKASLENTAPKLATNN